MSADNVIKMPGNPKIGAFSELLLNFIKERGDGLPFTAVIGCLELAKYTLIVRQRQEILGVDDDA